MSFDIPASNVTHSRVCEVYDYITPKVNIPGLTQGTDYYVSYKNNYLSGQATATVTGIGCYEGTRTVTFNIKSKDSAYTDNATILLNAYSIPLRIGQSTDKVRVYGLQDGDFVRSWASDNAKVVTVSPDGVIRALNKTGTASVTVRTYYGASASIKVKVQKKKVTTKKISVKKSITLKKGETYALDVLVTPITTSDRIKYKSAVRSFATVSGRGLVTAKAAGRTSITVTCGKKKAKININVI